MIEQCYVMLECGNKLYTDFDLYIPSRVNKRRMVGNSSSVFQYDWKFIREISDNTNKIVLLNPDNLCDRHTIAYETAAHLLGFDVDKLEIFNVSVNNLYYKYNDIPIEYKDAFDSFERYKKSAEHRPRKMCRWIQAFLHSIPRYYCDSGFEKDYMHDGYITYGEESYVIHRELIDRSSTLDFCEKFGLISIKLIGNPESSIVEIFDKSHGLITPLTSEQSHRGPYDEEYSSKCIFMVPREVDTESLIRIFEGHGVIYSYSNDNINNFNIPKVQHNFSIPYYM